MLIKEEIQKKENKSKPKISSEYRQYLDKTSELEKSEWIDGELVVHSPVLKRHLSVSRKLTRLMSAYTDRYDLGYVAFEKALINLKLGVQNYEPDIVFFSKEKTDSMTEKTSMFGVPDLVVEILSDGTERRDRGVKYQNYEKSKIPEYWIISAEKHIVEKYVLVNNKYILQKIYKIGDYIESEQIKGFHIPVRAIFDTYINLAELDRPLRTILEGKINEKERKFEIISKKFEIANTSIEEKEKTIEEKEKTIEEKEKTIKENVQILINTIKMMKKLGATSEQIKSVTKKPIEFVDSIKS